MTYNGRPHLIRNFCLMAQAKQSQNFMQLALEWAQKGAKAGEVPVGAVIVKNRTPIAMAHNLTITHNDPTAHAEIVAIRQACQQVGSQRLHGCDLYVTLEPCPMCAAAISFARLRRLYFAAFDPKGGGVEHGARLFSQPGCLHKPEIFSGIAETEAARILRDFFKSKR